MKPTKAQGLFLAVFLILCLIPSVGLLCFGPSEAGANEIAPSAPRLTAPDGSPNAAYLSDLTDYVGRRFFLRQELITAHNRLVSGVFGTSAEDDVLARTEHLDLLRAIHTLPEQTREVVYLRLFGDLSFREIGAVLGKTENWARVTFYRGKEKLREGAMGE